MHWECFNNLKPGKALTETLTDVAAGVVDFCDEGCRVLVLGFSFEYGGGGRPADLSEVFGGLKLP